MAEREKEANKCQNCYSSASRVAICDLDHELCDKCYHIMYDKNTQEYICSLCTQGEEAKTFAMEIPSPESGMGKSPVLSDNDVEVSTAERRAVTPRADGITALFQNRQISIDSGYDTPLAVFSGLDEDITNLERLSLHKVEIESSSNSPTIEGSSSTDENTIIHIHQQTTLGSVSRTVIDNSVTTYVPYEEPNIKQLVDAREELPAEKYFIPEAPQPISAPQYATPESPQQIQRPIIHYRKLDFQFKTLPIETNGAGQSQLDGPASIITAPLSQKVVVADTQNDRIILYDFERTPNPGPPQPIPHYYKSNLQFQPLILEAHGAGQSQFDGPSSITIAPHSQLIVIADTQNDRVLLYDSNGQYVMRFGSTGGLQGQFYKPWTLGILSSETRDEIVVANGDNEMFGEGRVLVLDMDGNYVQEIGQGHLRCPTGISCGYNLIAVCDGNFIIIFICSQSAPLWKISGRQGLELSDLLIVDDDTVIATGSQGMNIIRRPGGFPLEANIGHQRLEADQNNVSEHRSIINNMPSLEILGTEEKRVSSPSEDYTSEGNVLTSPREEKLECVYVLDIATGEIDTPRGLAIDSDGCLLVAFGTGVRVYKRVLDQSTYTHIYSIPLPTESGITNIRDVCVLPDGSLVICGSHGIIIYTIQPK